MNVMVGISLILINYVLKKKSSRYLSIIIIQKIIWKIGCQVKAFVEKPVDGSLLSSWTHSHDVSTTICTVSRSPVHPQQNK